MNKQYNDFAKRISKLYIFENTNYANVHNFKSLDTDSKDFIISIQKECDKLKGYYKKLNHTKDVKPIYHKVCDLTKDDFGNSLDDIQLDLDSEPLTRDLLQSNISLAILDLRDNVDEDYSVTIDV